MSSLIRELAVETAQLCESAENARRKDLWIRHHNPACGGRPIVNVHLWKMGDHAVWHEIIPDDTIAAMDPDERFVERQLKQRLFKFKEIVDEDVLLPTLWVDAAVERDEPEFGLSPLAEEPPTAGGAKRYGSVIRDASDVAKLHRPRWRVDEKSTALHVEKILEITDGRLPVKVKLPTLGTSPFEYLVRFRGMEEVLYDFYDNPDLIHQLMEFFTDCILRDYRDIERRYGLDPESTWDFRIHHDRPADPSSPFSLQNCWAYISAQSAGVISPAMFEEFLQPYHERIAAVFGKVYYHGCENLTQKAGIISRLPHLRRFHISPWSDLEAILDELGSAFVYETHVHPGSHLFVFSDDEIRKDVRRIALSCAERNVAADINLSDIETVLGDRKKLIRWSRIAQEAVAELSL